MPGRMLKLNDEQRQAFAAATRAAAERHDVRVAVRRLYDEFAVEVISRRPTCDASGRCCHFDRYGHHLLVTTAELAVFLGELESSEAGITATAAGGGSHARLVVLPTDRHGDACRFLRDERCSVHAIRPFGCRVFFCDPTAGAWQQAQYERFHGRLKRLHERLDVPYAYVEWREALACLQEAGAAREVGQTDTTVERL